MKLVSKTVQVQQQPDKGSTLVQQTNIVKSKYNGIFAHVTINKFFWLQPNELINPPGYKLDKLII